MEWKREHLTYFDPHTLQTALFQSGFREMIVQSGWKVLTLEYIVRHFERFPVALITPALKALRNWVPKSLRERQTRVVASGMAVFARKKSKPELPKLSIVLPAYNEVATFETLVEAVLRKQVPGMEIELVIVESASTDGTRELARKYEDHPRVRLVLEEKPRGKGHAVRAGLSQASGDFVLIQDADLEYDLEDYDALLEPLLAGREAFTLGARHGGGAWKMRQFTGQPLLSAALNGGHWFFTTLVNVLFRQRLKDPFTMYKVFRRDCLFGLRFECNRFDFDYELLVKILRKGFRALEIPVNYRSRSFKEGKKVSMFGDPWSWIMACLKLRVTSVNPMREIERSRAAGR
jgi:glycosyltransferase involved in cell wall biosynthesis